MRIEGDGPPRVILVEDDAALRRFVEMALEELDIALVSCSRLSEAVQALEAAPARLVLTDLMLGGESGLEFVQRLANEPGLRGEARIVVLSAGLSPEVRQRLALLPVWRVLAKPIGLTELERTVEEALAGSDGTMAAAQLDPVDEADAIARHFNGDESLYRAFRVTCLRQFAADAQDGDVACAQRDVQSLRRVAHNLKTVLRSLGHVVLGDLAAAIEDQASAGELASAAGLWRDRLQPSLVRLAGAGPAA